VHALKNSEQRSDRDLIERSLAGCAQAFEELLGRYQDRMFRLLGRYTRDAMETEDLAQDVFVKVFRKLHTFQHDSTFYTWLYRIAINTASDHIARVRRRRLHLVEDESALEAAGLDAQLRRGDADAGAAQPLLDEELRQVTRQILERLPEKYRTILVLREYEDLSYQEIAGVLGCSIGTVESRLFRARKRFKEAIERIHPDLVSSGRMADGREWRHGS
jgi:RNA polymerase sigma-70 factor (ECF subfamily)